MLELVSEGCSAWVVLRPGAWNQSSMWNPIRAWAGRPPTRAPDAGAGCPICYHGVWGGSQPHEWAGAGRAGPGAEAGEGHTHTRNPDS